MLYITGHFNNGNSYLINKIDGIQYHVEDTNLAVHHYYNIIKGKKEGNTSLSVSYQGKTVQIPLVVTPQDGFGPNADCMYTLSDSSWNVNHLGGGHIINITSSPLCKWSIANTNSWIHISPASEQIGNKAIKINIDTLQRGNSRIGSFDIGGITYTVNQSSLFEEREKLSVYPNPTTDVINIQGNYLQNGKYYLTLTDIVGKKIFEIEVNLSNNIFDRQLDLKGVPTGMYFLMIKSFQSRQIFKINKQ